MTSIFQLKPLRLAANFLCITSCSCWVSEFYDVFYVSCDSKTVAPRLQTTSSLFTATVKWSTIRLDRVALLVPDPSRANHTHLLKHQGEKAALILIFTEGGGGGSSPNPKLMTNFFINLFFSLSLDIYRERGGEGEAKSKLLRAVQAVQQKCKV